MATTTPTITKEQREQFQDEGYFILENAIPEHHLQLLRGELDRFISEADEEMDKAGTDVLGLNHRGKRYFIAMRYREAEPLEEFLFSDLAAEICKATLGPDVWLFWEQFVVKAADVGMSFSWHQDSGYLKQSLKTHARPYLTCWGALDDVNEENGTIYVLPFSKAGSREIIDHVRDEATNDLVGYTGDEPGVPVVVPAGGVAVFQTTVFHRSGPNRTNRPRRSYVFQYSAEEIRHPDGKPSGWVVPFLKDGERVR